ncbi:hypothetical protein I4U23_027953 [Adineta vaga]|nr:hypothetical protein I4U23_027953 [Adineta vaga]
MSSFNNNSTSVYYIKLQIQYGSDLYELLLSNKEKKISIEQVLDEIEKRTKVPKCYQILMYKGQRLDQKLKANLDGLYIFNNSKLILLRTPKQISDEQQCQKKVSYSSIQSPQNINEEDKCNDKNFVEIPSHPMNFIPEADKIYEYYTVPYRTDPTTLLQNMSLLSTSNNHQS